MNFQVDNLRASLSKADGDGVEKPLGDVFFDHFALALVMAKFDMKVDVNLKYGSLASDSRSLLMLTHRSLSLNLVQPGRDPIKFMASAEVDSPQDKNLLIVKYARAQTTSPDFSTIYESISQSVDITISTVIFRAAPEPVLTLYDFVMTTFVPKSDAPTVDTAAADQPTSTDELEPGLQKGDSSEVIRVKVKLASVQCEFALLKLFPSL